MPAFSSEQEIQNVYATDRGAQNAVKALSVTLPTLRGKTSKKTYDPKVSTRLDVDAACAIPARSWVGGNVDDAAELAELCAHRAVETGWFWAVVTTIVVALICWGTWAWNNADPSAGVWVLPWWVVPIPLVLGAVYAWWAPSNAVTKAHALELELQLSGMSRQNFLTYKAGNDAAHAALTASLAGSTLLTVGSAGAVALR